MLGLNPLGAKATSKSNFGKVQVNFAKDDVKCSGGESSLKYCPHIKTHNCGSHEGAGVICNDKSRGNISFFLFSLLHDFQGMVGGGPGPAGLPAQSHAVQEPDLDPEGVINLLLLMVGGIVQGQAL